MTRWARLAGTMAAACCCLSVAAGALANEVLLRVEVADPAAVVVKETDGGSTAEIHVLPGTDSVAVELDVVLVSRFEACTADPVACDGGERLSERGCFDGRDNDGDASVDRDDPDCIGVQGYALVVATDHSFHLRSNTGSEDTNGASFYGTASDDDTRPPGLAHPPILRYVDPVDPKRNEGQEGVVGACTLSLTTFVIIPPVAEVPILKLRGDLDVADIGPGERSEPCRVDIRGPGEKGLAGMGEATTTSVTVDGETFPFVNRDLDLVVVVDDLPFFRRGDANGDRSLDVSDSVYILNFLFSGGDPPDCLASADVDDSSDLLITDGIAVFSFLFLGLAPPAPPGPFECGPDPTPGDVPCDSFSSC